MRMHISKVLFVETGTYGDQFYRPYQAEYDGMSERRFVEVAGDVNRTTPTMLAGIAGDIVKPQSEVMGQVLIPQGWGERRLRFTLEACFTSNGGVMSRQYVSGWTDHVGATRSGSIDPRMRLFVNTVVELKDTMQRTVAGAQNIIGVADASHVISPASKTMSAYGYQGYPHQGLDLMTPQDVLMQMMCDDYTGVSSGDVTVENMATGTYENAARKSRRSNNISTNYLSRSLNAIAAAELAVLETGNITLPQCEVYGNAAQTMMERPIGADKFLALLDERTTFQQHHSVAWSELLALQPTLDDVTVIAFCDQQVLRPPSQRGEAESMHGATQETLIATIISQSVPAIMMDLMLTEFSFKATNLTLDGQPIVTPMHYRSFAEKLDIRPYVQRFIDRFLMEVMNDITHHNQAGVVIIADVDVLGDSRISVQYNNGQLTPFVIPSFSDARFSPIVTPNRQNLNMLTSALTMMGQHLGQNNVEFTQQTHHFATPTYHDNWSQSNDRPTSVL